MSKALHNYTLQVEVVVRAHGIHDAERRVQELRRRLRRAHGQTVNLDMVTSDDTRCDTCAGKVDEGYCRLKDG